MNKIVIASLAAVFGATAATAYDFHHPNLRDAWGASVDAIRHIQEAQVANKGVEFGGHAEKALDAFKQGQQELILGDQWNDAHHH